VYAILKRVRDRGTEHEGAQKTDGSHGIIPTIPVARAIAGVAAGRDELLERAREVVSADPAPAPGGSAQ
jgi:triphosphoribosyl-dephospho-CoA synthetase